MSLFRKMMGKKLAHQVRICEDNRRRADHLVYGKEACSRKSDARAFRRKIASMSMRVTDLQNKSKNVSLHGD
jgi:polyhydroxyalkanoate synthesis regulator phasin